MAEGTMNDILTYLKRLEKKIDDVNRKVERLYDLQGISDQGTNSTTQNGDWNRHHFDHDDELEEEEEVGDDEEEKIPEEQEKIDEPLSSNSIRPFEDLRDAIRNGDLTIVNDCLDNFRISPNYLFTGNVSPLHFAVGGNHKSIVKTLIQRGANVNSIDDKGRSPLHGAAILGHVSMASLLLSHGARTDLLTKGGESPLACAAGTGNLAMVKLLLEQGQAAIDFCDAETRRTPLFVAALHGRVNVICYLLENGAAIHKNGDGWNMQCENSLAEGVQQLVDRGAELQVRAALIIPEEHQEIKELLRELEGPMQNLGTPLKKMPPTFHLLDRPLPSPPTAVSYGYDDLPPLPTLSSPSYHSPSRSLDTSLQQSTSPRKQLWVTTEQGRGISVAGIMTRDDQNLPILLLDITNASSSTSSTFGIKFEPNSFGLAPNQLQFDLSRPLYFGETMEVSLPLKFDPLLIKKPEEYFTKTKEKGIQMEIKAAMKNMSTSQYFRFVFPVVLSAFCTVGTLETKAFLQQWNNINGRMVVTGPVRDVQNTDTEVVKNKLLSVAMGFVCGREVLGVNYSSATRTLLYFSGIIVDQPCLIEIMTETGRKHTCTVTVKSFDEAFSAMCHVLVSKRLRKHESE